MHLQSPPLAAAAATATAATAANKAADVYRKYTEIYVYYLI